MGDRTMTIHAAPCRRAGVFLIGSVLAGALLILGACQTTEMKGADVWRGPIIDAHSQADRGLDLARVIPDMNEGGVWNTLLAARLIRDDADVVAFAKANPARITPIAKSKIKAFLKGHSQFPAILERVLGTAQFKGISEVILWHAAKGSKAGQAVIAPSDPRVGEFLKHSRRMNAPLILHIEFAAAGADKGPFMSKMEALLAANRDHPFALTHMGQLRVKDASRLIKAHPNLYFITSHANPITIAKNKSQPWTNLFSGNKLKPAWRKLVVANPDRFVLAFDNVFPDHWGSFYLKQVSLWRKALFDLPDAVAHAVAHGNAERLWNLPPAQSAWNASAGTTGEAPKKKKRRKGMKGKKGRRQ
jgi:hypothetical protein